MRVSTSAIHLSMYHSCLVINMLVSQCLSLFRITFSYVFISFSWMYFFSCSHVFLFSFIHVQRFYRLDTQSIQSFMFSSCHSYPIWWKSFSYVSYCNISYVDFLSQMLNDFSYTYFSRLLHMHDFAAELARAAQQERKLSISGYVTKLT